MTKLKAHLWIHSWAAAHAATAFASAQWLDGGHAVLTAETIAAVGTFSKLCGATWSRSFLQSFVKQRMAEYAGKEILRQTAGKIPGIGNGLNASISLAVTEAILWSVYHECCKS